MTERKPIINCEAEVGAKIDLSTESARKKLLNHELAMNCPKANLQVDIEGTDLLFGVPMNVKCLHKECPFNKDRAPDLSDRPTEYPV